MLDKALKLGVNSSVPAQYHHNKLKTCVDIVRRISNWPTAVEMRLRRHRPGLRLLAFRDGLNVACRSRDWAAIHELLFAESYARGLEWIRAAASPPHVLDLGGNIGLFSLLAAKQRPDAVVYAFEPGPPNYRLFEMNLLANPELSERIHLRREAVGGATGTAKWFFDEQMPGASSLYGTSGKPLAVSIKAFSEVIATLGSPVCLAKIDIEGAEFDLLRETPPDAWKNVSAIEMEIHDDPSRQMTHEEFLEGMKALGYSVEEKDICSYFLRR